KMIKTYIYNHYREDIFFFFFQAEDGIRDRNVTGVQTCALPILINKAPCFSNSPIISSYIDASTSTLFSDEQLVELSNIFEVLILSAVSSRFADLSIYVGVFPVPTPIAGVPEL